MQLRYEQVIIFSSYITMKSFYQRNRNIYFSLLHYNEKFLHYNLFCSMNPHNVTNAQLIFNRSKLIEEYAYAIEWE